MAAPDRLVKKPSKRARPPEGHKKFMKEMMKNHEYWNAQARKIEVEYCEDTVVEVLNLITSTPIPYIELHKLYPHLPTYMTLSNWRKKYPEFAERYLQAKRMQVEQLADDLVLISDDASKDVLKRTVVTDEGTEHSETPNAAAISRSKLRVDTRKWLLSRMVDVFKDKSTVETNVTITHEDALKELE